MRGAALSQGLCFIKACGVETRGCGVRKSSLCHAWGIRMQAVGAGMQQLHGPRYCLKQKRAGRPSFHEELEKNTLPLNSGEIQVHFKRAAARLFPPCIPTGAATRETMLLGLTSRISPQMKGTRSCLNVYPAPTLSRHRGPSPRTCAAEGETRGMDQSKSN